MAVDETTRARRIARLKLSIVVTLLIVVALAAGVVLRLIEWL